MLLTSITHAVEPIPQLRGVLTIGDEWRAAIVTNDAGIARWCRSGDRIGTLVIDWIGADGVTLVGADGARRVLHLPDAKVMDANAPPAASDEWQRWVNSRANPMLETPAPLPVTPRQWLALTAERRRSIEERYRLHGWSVEVIVDAQGMPSVEFAPLQSDTRHVILAEKEQMFLRSLSPEQRTLHTATRRPGTAADATAPATATQKLRESLDATQRLAFAQLSDFSATMP